MRKGEAPRLRKLFGLIGGDFAGAALVGTVHDMRFALLDNDTKLMFATAYDGEWDAYVNDFATKITNILDVLFYPIEGWPGIRIPSIKDFILKHEISVDAWYVANRTPHAGGLIKVSRPNPFFPPTAALSSTKTRGDPLC